MINRGTSRPAALALRAAWRWSACWKLAGIGSKGARAMISRLAGEAVQVMTGPRPGVQPLMDPMATISHSLRCR